MTHICVGKLTIIGSDNGLSPGRRQAIIWTNAGILLIGPLGTNFSEILIATETFSFKKMHWKMSSAKWRLWVKPLLCWIILRKHSIDFFNSFLHTQCHGCWEPSDRRRQHKTAAMVLLEHSGLVIRIQLHIYLFFVKTTSSLIPERWRICSMIRM